MTEPNEIEVYITEKSNICIKKINTSEGKIDKIIITPDMVDIICERLKNLKKEIITDSEFDKPEAETIDTLKKENAKESKDYYMEKDSETGVYITFNLVTDNKIKKRAINREFNSAKKIKLKEMVGCIHCYKKYPASEILVYQNGTDKEDFRIFCKNHPDCGGSIIDLFPANDPDFKNDFTD